jgi:hypothetical protein
MKQISLVAVAFLLLTSVVCAETSPTQKNTDQVFDRFINLSSKYFNGNVVGFLKELKTDPAVDYKIYSFKPLAVNIYFASGKAMYINGNSADFVSENGLTTSDDLAGCVGFLLLGILLIVLGAISYSPPLLTFALVLTGVRILLEGFFSCFALM